jgi:hypothetical protein
MQEEIKGIKDIEEKSVKAKISAIKHGGREVQRKTSS